MLASRICLKTELTNISGARVTRRLNIVGLSIRQSQPCYLGLALEGNLVKYYVPYSHILYIYICLTHVFCRHTSQLNYCVFYVLFDHDTFKYTFDYLRFSCLIGVCKYGKNYIVVYWQHDKL